MNRTLPYAGLALGAISGTVGGTTLAALIFGAQGLSRRDRTTIGVVSLGLISMGTVLTALAHSQLAEAR